MITELMIVTKKGAQERFDRKTVRLCSECADEAKQSEYVIEAKLGDYHPIMAQSACSGCGQSADA